MFVLVCLVDGRPDATIEDHENLQQLHVTFRGIDDALAVKTLAAAGIGTVVDDHVWLDIESLRAAGGGSDEWSQGFDAMLAYARRNDWVDAQRARVRAHITRE